MFKKSCVCTQVFDDIATATAYAITSVHPRSVFGQTGPIVQMDIGHARFMLFLSSPCGFAAIYMREKFAFYPLNPEHLVRCDVL